MIDSKIKLYKERAMDFFLRTRSLFLPVKDAEASRAAIRRRAFATIERERRWGGTHVSGWGSAGERTLRPQAVLSQVIEEFGIRSMLDVACGDFSWMPAMLEQAPQGFKYVGCDIVPALIERNASAFPQYEFRVLDFVTDPLPSCDLILCRDALQHLPVADIKKALKNFSESGSGYLLASTHLRRFGWKNARECRAGQCRDRNLLLRPFNLPDPIVIFAEQDQSHKFLGLWKLPF